MLTESNAPSKPVDPDAIPPAPGTPSPTDTETLLVLDDDPLVLKVSCRELERLGYTVIPAPSGETAIGWLEQHDADLVLLDLMLPELNGVETYKRILSFKPDQKAIVYSGYAEPGLMHEAADLGAEPIIIKPARNNELARAIREKLGEPHAPPAHEPV